MVKTLYYGTIQIFYAKFQQCAQFTYVSVFHRPIILIILCILIVWLVSILFALYRSSLVGYNIWFAYHVNIRVPPNQPNLHL